MPTINRLSIQPLPRIELHERRPNQSVLPVKGNGTIEYRPAGDARIPYGGAVFQAAGGIQRMAAHAGNGDDVHVLIHRDDAVLLRKRREGRQGRLSLRALVGARL